ncbi:hypothetical protein KY285_001042 [Solanum tuberosum]|nr:hypothetical protein KY285_001042 [Solanum tuberosum]
MMSGTPSSNACSPTAPCTPTTPSTPNVSIGSSSCSSTSSRLVISVVAKRSSQKLSKNDKILLATHGRMSVNPLVNFIDMNFCEAGGLGTGSSKHTGSSKSTVEHTIKLAIELCRPPNSWDIFKKLHKRKDVSFVNAKSKCINAALCAVFGSDLNSFFIIVLIRCCAIIWAALMQF